MHLYNIILTLETKVIAVMEKLFQVHLVFV